MAQEDAHKGTKLRDPPGESDIEYFESDNFEEGFEIPVINDRRGKTKKGCHPPDDEEFSEASDSDWESDDSDDDYHLFAHVDDKLVTRIKEGWFVELSKLLPKSKIVVDDEEDNFAMVNRDGRMYLSRATPNHDKEQLPSINSYSKWQTAFRIFAAIYSKEFPNKGAELYQYQHSIQKAASKFYWDNVYNYDILFRKRMAKHHPRKSWALRYDTAWTFELMDKLPRQDPSAAGYVVPDNYTQSGELNKGHSPNMNNKGKKYCGLLNKTGKCKYGKLCRFEHRCYFCHKKGHGIVSCRGVRENKGGSSKEGKY